MIVAHQISKRYGRVRALEPLDLELPAGQIAGLLGPNGAGKSTTIRILTGSLPPDTGDAWIAGHSVVGDPVRARQHLGYLPESAPVYPEMSVDGYLWFRARLAGVHASIRRVNCDRVMDRCGLLSVRARRTGSLSKGYRQRVGLAAAMVQDPSVLILDEPTNGLDPTQVRDLRGLVRELAAERTVLLCSHILPEVERTCDRVIVLIGGRVRADGRPSDLGVALARRGSGTGGPTYTAEVQIRVGTPDPAGVGALRALPGVQDVGVDDDGPEDATAGWRRVSIRGANGAGDLREAIARALAGAGLVVRELRPPAASLEDLFVDLVEGDARPSTSAPGEGAAA
jgi:ABC-2 type transport system ATP-binding protein